MLIGDRPTTPYDLNFRVLGVHLRVHTVFWLLSAVLGHYSGPPKFELLWVGVVFVSILVHEMGHALAIRAYGWRPTILLYSFGGLAIYQPTHHDPRKQIAISLAGPAAGFVLAALTCLLFKALGNSIEFSKGGPTGFQWILFVKDDSVSTNTLAHLVDQLLQVNIWWGLVNLLPIWPLDGGHVCYESLLELRVRDALAKALMVSVTLAGAIGIFSLDRPAWSSTWL